MTLKDILPGFAQNYVHVSCIYVHVGVLIEVSDEFDGDAPEPAAQIDRYAACKAARPHDAVQGFSPSHPIRPPPMPRPFPFPFCSSGNQIEVKWNQDAMKKAPKHTE